MRNEPNVSLESNFLEWWQTNRQNVDDLLDVFEHLRAVRPHFFRPCQLAVLEYGFQDEQRPVEP